MNGDQLHFVNNPALTVELQAFNDKWRCRNRLLRRVKHRPFPFELSIVVDYLRDLGAMLALGLPAEDWLPSGLQKPAGPWAWQCWQDLTAMQPGSWTFKAEALLPLVCALAAPPRFGTAAGRYPEQLEYLRRRFTGRTGTIRILDLACGTGQGTLELARLFGGLGCSGKVFGVTQAPLEVWMARHRHMPHAPDAEFPEPPESVAVDFTVGRVLDYTAALPEPVDVLVCNGLIGGAWLFDEQDFAALWDCFQRCTRPGSLLTFACRFHAGWQARFNAFLRAAPGSWECRRFQHGAGFSR